MKKITLNLLLPILTVSFLAACSSPAADEASKNNNASSPSVELKRPEQPASVASSAQPSTTPAGPTPQISPATPAASPAPSAPTQPLSSMALPKMVLPVQKIDFGRQPKAKSLTKSIMIKNTGKADLNIESVQPSCGCTTVDFPKVIAPGKSGAIKVKVDTGQSSGSHTKSVTIKTNDPVQPSVQVELAFTVK